MTDSQALSPETQSVTATTAVVAADSHAHPLGPSKQRTKNLMADGLVAVSSLAAGGIMAWRAILSESYANFTQLDLADDIKKKFRTDFWSCTCSKI